MTAIEDLRFMSAAIALAKRGQGRTSPNPNVGCVIVRDGAVVGRGWTQPGGRPHAEAQALAQASDRARGGTAYVTLEPCFHLSPRGPRCTDLLVRAGVARVVIAAIDPDPRTDGQSVHWLREQGVEVTTGLLTDEARAVMAGFFLRQTEARPFVTLKLALSLDGCIALADGSSRWITGDVARAHCHAERARHEGILIGRGTLEADQPRLDVRLPGLEDRSPRRILLSRNAPPEGWQSIACPRDIGQIPDISTLMIEGGAQTAAAFLREDLVDRLLLYRAPIIIGGGKSAIADMGLTDLADAHGRWRLTDSAQLGKDRMEVYLRTRTG